MYYLSLLFAETVSLCGHAYSTMFIHCAALSHRACVREKERERERDARTRACVRVSRGGGVFNYSIGTQGCVACAGKKNCGFRCIQLSFYICQASQHTHIHTRARANTHTLSLFLSLFCGHQTSRLLELNPPPTPFRAWNCARCLNSKL